MKNTIIILLAMIVSTFAFAKTNKNIIKTQITVHGNCGMCKDRIEDAANISGVKQAIWNKKTQVLDVIFDSTKTTKIKIEEAIAKAGHDTEDVKALDENYKTLPSCCAYRDGAKCTH